MYIRTIKSDIKNNKTAFFIHGLKTGKFFDILLHRDSKSNIINRHYVNRFSKWLKGYYEEVIVLKYDDRKLSSEISQDFINILKKLVNPDKRVDIFGHSKGGLISVYTSILYPNDTKNVDNIISLCSPFQGYDPPLWQKFLYKIKLTSFISMFSTKGFGRFCTLGYKELFDFDKMNDSIVNLISTNFHNINSKINYCNISSKVDKYSIPLKSRLINESAKVRNLFYDPTHLDKTKQVEFEHDNLLEMLHNNSLDDLIQSILRPNNNVIGREFHIFENCNPNRPQLNQDLANSFRICPDCVKKSTSDFYENENIKGDNSGKKILVVLSDEGELAVDEETKSLKNNLKNSHYYDTIYFPKLDKLKNKPEQYKTDISFFINDNVEFDFVCLKSKYLKYTQRYLDALSEMKKQVSKIYFLNMGTKRILNFDSFKDKPLVIYIESEEEDFDDFKGDQNHILVHFEYDSKFIKNSLSKKNIVLKMDTNGFCELLQAIFNYPEWKKSNNPFHEKLFHFSNNCAKEKVNSVFNDHYIVCSDCISLENNLQ